MWLRDLPACRSFENQPELLTLRFVWCKNCTGFSSSNELNHYGEHQEHMVISPSLQHCRWCHHVHLWKLTTVENCHLLIQLFLKQWLSFG